MSSSNENTGINRKKQENIDAKENEIEETLNTVSYKDVKESKKEANELGDSEK